MRQVNAHTFLWGDTKKADPLKCQERERVWVKRKNEETREKVHQSKENRVEANWKRKKKLSSLSLSLHLVTGDTFSGLFFSFFLSRSMKLFICPQICVFVCLRRLRTPSSIEVNVLSVSTYTYSSSSSSCVCFMFHPRQVSCSLLAAVPRDVVKRTLAQDTVMLRRKKKRKEILQSQARAE